MTTERIAMLDILRGVAVVGILLANIAAFGLPEGAYFSPLPWGGMGIADKAAWALTFVLVEGKMRALFSFLFGASMLLVVDRARAGGEDAASVHYSRMAWLFLIGVVHLYLFWWGDILTHYALVGAVAFLFVDLPVGGLLAAGVMAVALQTILNIVPGLPVLAGAPGSAGVLADFGAADPARFGAEVAAMRGGFAEAVGWRVANVVGPVDFAPLIGAETLGYMLFGMAGLRSGFLTGRWDRRRYARWAAVSLTIGWAAYGVLAVLTIRSGFDPRQVLIGSIMASTPVRPVLVIGYACVVMLLARPGGWLTERIAAAGQAAFTNYLGTTLAMTFVFDGWGLGLFGRLARAELYWPVPVIWTVMLVWSKPWLERFRYGPLEWLWRSLARLEWQPMRR